MLTFWLVCITLFILAILLIIYPLLRNKATTVTIENNIDQEAFNISIAKDQLENLEQSFLKNEVSQEEYDALKYELESSLISDLSLTDSGEENEKDAPSQKILSLKVVFVVIALFIPLFSSVMYQILGSPELIASENVTNSLPENATVEDMQIALEKKLKDNPKDQQGWYMLARTYMSMKKFDKAYDTFAKLMTMTGEDPELLISMADAKAMSQGGVLAGEPDKLIQRALELNPESISGLWLAGLVSKEANNNDKALVHWNKLLPLLENEPESKKTLIAMMEEIGGSVDGTSADNQSEILRTSIQLNVSATEDILKQADQDLYVYIYAKAKTGPPMPLAVSKQQVKNLPITVTLDDTMAMMQQMKISKFPSIKVGARISLSGSAMKQAGDYMSDEVTIDQWMSVKPEEATSLLINRKL